MTDQELLQAMRNMIVPLQNQMTRVEEAVHKTNLHIESEIWPAIQKLAEGHEMILDRIDDKIERRTEQLQEQIDVHQAAIIRINREIQELKKVQ